MSRVVRWDPFHDMISVRNQMDRLVDDLLQTNSSNGESSSSFQRLALDVQENDDAFTIYASVPGVNPDDLDISFSDSVLTIKGETRGENVSENEKWHLRERRFGQFQRSISLPTAIDADNIDASYNNGVLTLTLPKAEETKPRRIMVNSNGHKQTIEG